MTIYGTYMHLWSFMTSHIKSRHHPDISTVGLGFPSRLQLARLRPSPPWSCAVWMQNAPVLLPHGEWNTKPKTTKIIETMSNIVKPRLSWTFHGPFMDLSWTFHGPFMDLSWTFHVSLSISRQWWRLSSLKTHFQILSDTFSLSAFFSFLTLVLFGSQISSASVPKGLRFFIHFRESQVPQGHHAAVHWSHPELFTSLRLDHIPSYSIHQLN